ncbi:PD40 domain-containing protein [candidate division KSB1 bacterium]|nr:PD40 domain-containing protein [candidate division KSB1 bacterium]
MQNNLRAVISPIILICIGLCLSCTGPVEMPRLASLTPLADQPILHPDYTDITLPPNIAPLNFVIENPGEAYFVEISGELGSLIRISSRKPEIRIPLKSWKTLLESNQGKDIRMDMCVKSKTGEWKRLTPVINHVSEDSIDPILVYRRLHPMYYLWQNMGLYQRNLETFSETTLITNNQIEHSCFNCHTFVQNRSETMMMHFRAGQVSGLYVKDGDRHLKINTATDFNKPAAYPSYHPDGKRIAFSINNLGMFFHATGDTREVIDMMSDLVIYDVDKNQITTDIQISHPDYLETFPAWSPDGRALYFCRTNKLTDYTAGSDKDPQLQYNNVRYDLIRIGYNPETGEWGKLETVLSSGECGQSITIPRISPDGHFALVCMADHGNFPVYVRTSDIGMVDLETGYWWKPDINSAQSESYHNWSSTGRWIVFSSKRGTGQLARPHFAHVDKNGQTGKPFVMPQEDPAFYDSFLETYNLPELLTGPVELNAREMIRTMYDNEHIVQATLDSAVTHRNDLAEARTGWYILPY